ncbi:MAG TPA: hypothetical protein VK645_13720 [Chitinophagaceae bacterium]|nr:hypothetical protein [Chitinophagaceae bacterium]
MKPSVYTSGYLQMRIAELEILSLQQEQDLKNSFNVVLDDLKPVNLIRGAFSSTVKSPGFGKNLLKGALGLAVGFVSKKIFVMGSSNIVKKALGTVVELGVAKVVANKADKITSTGIKMLNKAIK